jgi:hypothetical protein
MANLEKRSEKANIWKNRFGIALIAGACILISPDMNRSIGDYGDYYGPKIKAAYTHVVDYFQKQNPENKEENGKIYK